MLDSRSFDYLLSEFICDVLVHLNNDATHRKKGKKGKVQGFHVEFKSCLNQLSLSHD